MASSNTSGGARPLRSASGAILVPDRRQRSRLRELCDEVLASFRIASDRDPISELDRAVANQILPKLSPMRRN